MNWIDYAVIGIIAGYALIGYARGCVYSVFKVASFFIAGFMAVKFYPMVSKILISSMHLDKTLKDVFFKNIGQAIASGKIQDGANGAAAQTAENLISSWGLPDAVQSTLVKNMSAETGNIAQNAVQSIAGSLSESLSILGVNIISMILIFAVISFALIFVRNFLDGIARLPIFKQINRAGGLIFGSLQGLMIVYIVFAVLTLFASAHELKTLFADMSSSLIAKQLYSNNLLLLWAFGGKGG